MGIWRVLASPSVVWSPISLCVGTSSALMRWGLVGIALEDVRLLVGHSAAVNVAPTPLSSQRWLATEVDLVGATPELCRSESTKVSQQQLSKIWVDYRPDI